MVHCYLKDFYSEERTTKNVHTKQTGISSRNSKFLRVPSPWEGWFHTELACLDMGIDYPLVIKRGKVKSFAMENPRAQRMF